MVWMISNNWICICSLWCWMLGALLFQFEVGLLLISIYSCLYLVTHHLSHNLRDCLCSRWTYQHDTLLTLLFKALLIHFEYHWHLASCVSHLVSLSSHSFTLSVVCLLLVGLCNYGCSCLGYLCSLRSGILFSVVAVASL